MFERLPVIYFVAVATSVLIIALFTKRPDYGDNKSHRGDGQIDTVNAADIRQVAIATE